MSTRPKIVVLDDYEDFLRKTADWKAVESRADVTFHTQRLRGDALFEAIKDADAIALIRDRTPFKAELLAKLPKLKFFAFTGVRNTTMGQARRATGPRRAVRASCWMSRISSRHWSNVAARAWCISFGSDPSTTYGA